MTSSHGRSALLLAALAAAAATGCGGGDSGGDGGAAQAPAKTTTTTKAAAPAAGSIALAADPSGAIKFDKTKLTAKAGAVSIAFTNASQTPHAVEIEGHGETKTITGGEATLKATLKPGTYTFYCPVADHREEGMKGTLTVK